MPTLSRLLRQRLSSEPIDAWLSRWGCAFGGLGTSGLAVVLFWRNAENTLELLFGSIVALVACVLLGLLGGLARKVHLAVWEGKLTWHLRRWELVSHGIGLGVLGIGAWTLMIVPLGIVDLVTAAMMLLSSYAAILCLGCWSTLSRSGTKLE